MPSYDDFLVAIEDGVKELAKTTVKEFKDEAVTDAESFLEASKDELQKWVKQLSKGELTKDDFEWLVLGRKDAAELHRLKQSGLALVRVDKFKKAFLNLVIDTASDVFL